MNKRTIVLGLACGLGVIGSLYGNDFSKNKQKALKYYSEKDFDAAYEYCIKSDQNDPEIQQRLAWMYSTGSGVQKNMSKAISFSQKAADAGNGKAALYYAYWKLIPQKKYIDALKYLKLALKTNSAEAGYLIGWMYAAGHIDGKRNITKAIEYYKRASEMTPPSYGATYAYALCIAKNNPSLSIELTKKAYAGKYPMAARRLGDFYYHGYGEIKVDYKKAAEYYKETLKLVKNSFLSAQEKNNEEIHCLIYLGSIYAEQNPDAAIKYWQAALTNTGITKENAGDIEYAIANIYIDQKQWEKAYMHFEKAASYGKAAAYVDLGRMHTAEEGVPKDLKKAKEFFEKAMAAGVSDGFIQMGIMYMVGEGGAYNETKAEECFKRAIEIDNNHHALSYLADLYLQQNKVDKALPIILAAKKSGETCAQFDLLLVKILERGTTQVDKSMISNLRNTLENEVKKGNPTASYYLSRYLDSGILGNVDEKRSQQLLRYASDNGVCCASCLLAQKRIAVAKPSTDDIQFAYQYAKKALKQNPNCLDALHLLGTGALVNEYWENPQAGMTYLTEAANKNCPSAALFVGLHYAWPGKSGIEKNYAKAIHYLNIAQREPQLHSLIQPYVLHIEMMEALDKENIDAQKVIFAKVKKLAEEGNFIAWNFVALWYESGLGTPVDTQKAKFWSEKFLNFEGDPRSNTDLRNLARKTHQEAMAIAKNAAEDEKKRETNKKKNDSLESSVPTTDITDSGAGRIYVVQSGDSPGLIARRFGVSISALMAANNFDQESCLRHLKVGQKLVIPGKGNANIEPSVTVPAVKDTTAEQKTVAPQNRNAEMDVHTDKSDKTMAIAKNAAEDEIKRKINKAIEEINADPTMKNNLITLKKSAADIPPPTKEEMQCLQLMMQGKIHEAEELALEIKTHYPLVMLPLGEQYVVGKAVPRNLGKAKMYLQYCQMLPPGKYLLGQIYVLEGDFAKAKELFSIAANAGLTAAEPFIFYCSGKIAMKSSDFAEAKKYFEQAYSLGLKGVETELNLIKTMGF